MPFSLKIILTVAIAVSVCYAQPELTMHQLEENVPGIEARDKGKEARDKGKATSKKRLRKKGERGRNTKRRE